MNNRDEEFEYSFCSKCGVVFLSKRPWENEVSRYYTNEYEPYSQHKRLNTGKVKPFRLPRVLRSAFTRRPAQGRFQKRIETRYYDMLSEGMVFLDFGCGAGKFLNRVRDRGCITIGMDFSPIAIKEVQRNGHKGLLVNVGVWEQIQDESVQFVRMNHVIEHLYHPSRVLKMLHCKMAKGGRLHIAVPNPGGWSASLFRTYWHGLDCPRHVALYPPKALVRLLKTNGFDDPIVIHEPLAKDHIRSWGYLFHEFGWVRHEAINGLISQPVLNGVFAAPAALAAMMRRGDRFHIFVTK